MANVIYPNVGEVALLEELKPFFEACELAPFVNDVELADDNVLGDFTLASDVAPQNPVFGSVTTDGQGKAFMELDDSISFTQTEAVTQTVYGFVLYDGATLIRASRLAAPVDLENDNDVVTLQVLKIRLFDHADC